jgi:hypothetical protein
MHRRVLSWYGLFLLFAPQALLLAFGVDSLDVGTVGLTYGFMLLAGSLFVVAGSRREVHVAGLTVPWNVFAGVGVVCVAVTVLAGGAADLLAGDQSRAALAYTLVAAVGALTLVFIGVDVARGGHHFRLPDD